MISLLKTFLLFSICLFQFSFSSVIPRHYRTSSSNNQQGQDVASTSSLEPAIPAVKSNPSLPTPSPESDSEQSDSDNSDDTCDTNSDDSETDGSSSTLSTVNGIPSPTKAAQSASATPTTVVVSTSTSATAKPTSTQAAGEFWRPAAGSTWQIELSGIVTDTTYPADVFDLDLFDTPQSTIDALHAAGKKVICYFSAGSFENWRSDQADFQAADKGSPMEGWEGEWWLNTKTANVRSIMAARINIAAGKGCDAVDPDNVDGYANENGVGLTEADATDFLNFLADTAHAKGLSIGLKNAGGLVGDVLDKMQFHVNEQCIEFDECELFKPFIDAGKPVFHIEYPETTSSIAADVKSKKCTAANTMSFSTVLKNEALNAWIDTC